MLAQAVVLHSDGKEGKAMTRRGFALGRRLAILAAAGVLVLSLAGDRGRASTVPAPVYGQDPLEVLELKVRERHRRADSSGSMTPPALGGGAPDGEPGLEAAQAKRVIPRS
jgi:hypothetical protein